MVAVLKGGFQCGPTFRFLWLQRGMSCKMEIQKIQKRDGRIVPFESEKIVAAIYKANNEVEEKDRASAELVQNILDYIEEQDDKTIAVEKVQDLIEECLVNSNKYTLAKKYIVYRYQRSLLRKSNTTDESILKLIRNENKELAEENSNKNTRLA